MITLEILNANDAWEIADALRHSALRNRSQAKICEEPELAAALISCAQLLEHYATKLEGEN